MNIEFLYFQGCPNTPKAFDLLQSVLREQNIDASIRRIEIKTDEDAVHHQFIGSPTIRIEGVDVETVADERPYAKACRVYLIDGKFTGVPSKVMVENALWGRKRHKVVALGAVKL